MSEDVTMRAIVDRARAAAGQSVVEFSLISLALMMLFFGIIDLGRGVTTRVLLANAAREASRYGTIASRTDTAAFESGVIAAAAKTSPSLDLTAANFRDASGASEVRCTTWDAPAGNSGTLAACQTTAVTNQNGRLRVCITHNFELAATQLIGLTTITMRECARATLH